MIDWEATLAYREHLWSLGFGVAEAMDTAQRGMGLDWPLALELIQRSTAAAKARGALVASGAGTDHCQQDKPHLQRCDKRLPGTVRSHRSRRRTHHSDGEPCLGRRRPPCRRLRIGLCRVLAQVRHQLSSTGGTNVDPALEGYWGGNTISAATENCLSVIRPKRKKSTASKFLCSMPSSKSPCAVQLPADVRMYTGDDFNYDRLILGDGQGHSDALLGIFDAIAPAASLALTDSMRRISRYQQLLAPTVPLSRHIFASPTQHYKTGVVFLAFLNGFQSHFHMVRGMESARLDGPPLRTICARRQGRSIARP